MVACVVTNQEKEAVSFTLLATDRVSPWPRVHSVLSSCQDSAQCKPAAYIYMTIH